MSEFEPKENYLKISVIQDKEFYYKLINEISNSFISRIIINFNHTNIINLLIEEIAQSLINSVNLFELGYFDSAYYSMRTSIELATQ